MVAGIRIQSKTDRRRLLPRREPYWSRVEAGCFVGYRKLAEGEGTWIARWRDPDGKQHYRALGHFEEGDGIAKTAFDQAIVSAREWFRSLQSGMRPDVVTIEDACRAYVSNRRIEKGEATADDAEGRFRRRVYGSDFGRIPLDKLRVSDVRNWRDARLAKIPVDDEEKTRRAKDSANRDLSTLKAALNLAVANQAIGSDSAWASVRAFPDVGERRNLFLTLADRQALLAKAPADLERFARAMLLTGARPGELAALDAADFDRHLGTLALDGKTGKRVVTLSTAALAFFTEQAKDRIAGAPMLPRSDGNRWDRHSWKGALKDAVVAANLPARVVLYTLRHTAISEMIAAGMDSFVVARLAGTSTAMIDRHYGHLRHDRTRARLDAVQMV